MNDAASLLKSLGEPEKIAARVKVDVNTPRVWASRNRIPRSAWPELMLAFPRKATLKKLLETERAAEAA